MLTLNYLVLMFATNFAWLVLSMSLITISEMLAMPFMSTFMIKRAVEGRKGAYASLYSMTWSIAQIISPIIATQTIARTGHQSLWMLFALFGISINLPFNWRLSLAEEVTEILYIEHLIRLIGVLLERLS